jgi:hypothetical protein
LLLLTVLSVSYPKIYCPLQCHETFHLCFLQGVIVLVLIFISLIHFNFHIWNKNMVTSTIFSVYNPSFYTICWRECTFPIL